MGLDGMDLCIENLTHFTLPAALSSIRGQALVANGKLHWSRVQHHLQRPASRRQLADTTDKVCNTKTSHRELQKNSAFYDCWRFSSQSIHPVWVFHTPLWTGINWPNLVSWAQGRVMYTNSKLDFQCFSAEFDHFCNAFPPCKFHCKVSHPEIHFQLVKSKRPKTCSSTKASSKWFSFWPIFSLLIYLEFRLWVPIPCPSPPNPHRQCLLLDAPAQDDQHDVHMKSRC